jgi:SAM-dependent methyltransferase
MKMAEPVKNNASDMSVDEVRVKLKEHFRDIPESELGNSWDKLWSEENFMPWDRGRSNPAFIDLVDNRRDQLPKQDPLEPAGKRQRALVPGCGRGYDVLFLGSRGFDATGLEVSKGALQACEGFEKASVEDYKAKDPNIGKGSISWVQGDFFKNDWNTNGNGKFDLIYDYTFFCAMPLSLRPALAKRYYELLASDGVLICLEFPLSKPLSSEGPPFAMREQVYTCHLGHPGESLPYDENGKLLEEQVSPSSSTGLKRVARWLAQDTFAVGAGQDHISVWRHG